MNLRDTKDEKLGINFTAPDGSTWSSEIAYKAHERDAQIADFLEQYKEISATKKDDEVVVFLGWMGGREEEDKATIVAFASEDYRWGEVAKLNDNETIDFFIAPRSAFISTHKDWDYELNDIAEVEYLQDYIWGWMERK